MALMNARSVSVGQQPVCSERKHALERLEMPMLVYHDEPVLLSGRGPNRPCYKDFGPQETSRERRATRMR